MSTKRENGRETSIGNGIEEINGKMNSELSSKPNNSSRWKRLKNGRIGSSKSPIGEIFSRSKKNAVAPRKVTIVIIILLNM